MIEYNISANNIDSAKRRLNLVTKFSNNLSKYGSEKKRIFEGYLGEEIISDFLGISKVDDTYEFDMISNKGKKIEIKTVSCSFKPKPDYLCTVNSHTEKYVHKQDADYYIFLRIMNDYSVGWILGWIPCSEFFNIGTFVKKNTDFGKFRFTKANATVLEINRLNKF
tara:strand:- start:3136 stop:3633 length:498 start_codon:yes stop_codon:yes gene_type:complete